MTLIDYIYDSELDYITVIFDDSEAELPLEKLYEFIGDVERMWVMPGVDGEPVEQCTTMSAKDYLESTLDFEWLQEEIKNYYASSSPE